MAPGIAEPPNDPHWRTARGYPPEARTTWPSAPWGFGRGANLAARARHPPRPDLAQSRQDLRGSQTATT